MVSGSQSVKGHGKVECPECGKQIMQGSLKKHMQFHTGQYSHYCGICRRGYNNTATYKDHMRGHEGLKYHCEYCSKPFMSKKYYQYHLSEHTGRYRFICKMCNKGFNEKRPFDEHLKSHL